MIVDVGGPLWEDNFDCVVLGYYIFEFVDEGVVEHELVVEVGQMILSGHVVLEVKIGFPLAEDGETGFNVKINLVLVPVGV